MTKTLTILVFLLGSVSAAHARGPMNIDQWSKTGGGSFTLDTVTYDDGVNPPVTDKIIAAEPWAGFFLFPNWAATATLHLQFSMGENRENIPDIIGFSAGARYFRQFYHFYFYAGLELGVISYSSNSSNNNVNNNNNNTKMRAISGLDKDGGAFLWKLPAGVLLPLTRTLAIDVGIRVISLHFDSDVRWTETSFGYLGVFFTF